MRSLLGAVRPSLVLVALGVGTWLRVRGIGAVPLFGDEHHTLLAADGTWSSLFGTFDEFGSHVPLALFQRLALDLFGPGLVSFRLVALLPGLATLLLAYPLLRRLVGADPAALATAWLALSPIHVYYSRFGRSYALVGLLALVFVWRLDAWLAGKRGWLSGAALALCAALLPWVHLSTTGFLGASGLAGLLLAAREGRETALRLLGLLALAAFGSTLLYAPVLGEVVAYFRAMEPEEGSLLSLGTTTLLAGGRIAGLVGLALLTVAAWKLWRQPWRGAFLACAGLAGAVGLLALTVPRGMDYAWARYLLLALPFAFVLAADAFLLPARRFGGAALAVGLLAGAGLGFRGRWSVPPELRGPGSSFSNTYLALHPLPAFDAPYPRASALYRVLAGEPDETRVIEVPPIATRAVLLYRSHARAHGKRVRIGWVGALPRGLRGTPYVALAELTAADGDWLVLHRDPRREASRYFRFVREEAWPSLRTAGDEPFMARHEALYRANLPDTESVARMAEPLRARFGPPAHEDEEVLAWRLAP